MCNGFHSSLPSCLLLPVVQEFAIVYSQDMEALKNL